MKRSSFLRDSDLDGIDAGIGLLLTEYGRGNISPEDVVLNIGHLVVIIDIGNEAEVSTFIANPMLLQKD
jgi:hypothetical protein